MHSLQKITLALGFFASAALGGGLGIMARSELTSVSGLEARQLTCSGSNPNVCEQTADSIKCGQNCCSDGTSCEFGYSCQSGGRCCDERYPLSQCGVATLCYDATDPKCPNAEECCPSATPFCTYDGIRAICQLSTTYTSTITDKSTSTSTYSSGSPSTSTSTYSSALTSTLTSTKATTKVSSTVETGTYTSTTAYSSATHTPTPIASSNTTAPNATLPTASAPPVFVGAAVRNGIDVGIVAAIVAIGAALL